PAERIPDDVDAELTIVESTRLERAQRGVQLLDRTATWLPWLLLGVGALAVLIAPERSRGLLVVAGGITLAMVLVAAALALARNWYVDNGTGDDVARDAALSIARTILAPLRTLLRAVLVLGAAVTLAAFLAGPSRAATGVRRSAAHAVGALRARGGMGGPEQGGAASHRGRHGGTGLRALDLSERRRRRRHRARRARRLRRHRAAGRGPGRRPVTRRG
ncbi:MAG TPA: hypothetical protein VE575_02200, partial [Acidimicrobiales bacterium]|nr:hypothetical protein [Acidimicrobiales bacterium]